MVVEAGLDESKEDELEADDRLGPEDGLGMGVTLGEREALAGEDGISVVSFGTVALPIDDI